VYKRKSHLEDGTPDDKRQRAIKMILDFAGSKRVDQDGDEVAHTIKAVYAHFDTQKAFEKSTSLECCWRILIDELVRSGRIRVTNGFCWLPPEPRWSEMQEPDGQLGIDVKTNPSR
jgi:hypothetical protein